MVPMIQIRMVMVCTGRRGVVDATKAAVFEEGLLWGGYVNDSIQVNGNTHRLLDIIYYRDRLLPVLPLTVHFLEACGKKDIKTRL